MLTPFRKNPLHDQYSHGADAFRMIALGVQETRQVKQKSVKYQQFGQPHSWMG